MKAIILAALAAAGAPGFAQDAPMAPLELWGGISYLEPGMSVHKAYPKHSTYLTDHCKAEIGWTVDDTKEKRLTTLKLSDGFNGSGCGPLVRDGLRAKYGEPVDISVTQPTFPHNVKVTKYRFQSREVRITFEMSEGAAGGDWWNATYEPLTNVTGIAAKL